MPKIFYNGNIVTFQNKDHTAEAIFVNDGSIVLVGSNEEVLELKDDSTEMVDLQGKTVLPSFYDTNAKVFAMIENKPKLMKIMISSPILKFINLNFCKFKMTISVMV